ncbi:unnamed protein product [Arabis nemorensis]|uniref:MBD domain-containing protein n=1 Tax=Arabis nemorensis TaxID=586526 RepID=A0A565CST3_9BRAS|nr:unnamed protein product [Arabis nemorensis]
MDDATPNASGERKQPNLVDTFVAQCGKCYKWRSIESQEDYEVIRSKALDKSFECKHNCEEPGDVDVEGDSTRVWLVDNQHGLPKTPHGLKRILVLRESCERVDVYYVTPQGKRLKSRKEVAGFIKDNKSFKGTRIEDFSFVTPKPMKKTMFK